jgi:Catalase
MTAHSSILRSISVQMAVSRYVLLPAIQHLLTMDTQTLTNEEAGKLAGENPDYGIQGLFNTIEAGKFPSWTVYIVSIFICFAKAHTYSCYSKQ